MDQVIKGFTLIEVIIAISVLAIGIVGVLYMFPTGIQIARSSWMSTIATELAQIKMEENLSKLYVDISPETKKPLSFPLNAYFREVEVTCFDPNGTGVSPDCSDPDGTGIKKIKVTVSWGTPTKEIELNTLVAKR